MKLMSLCSVPIAWLDGCFFAFVPIIIWNRPRLTPDDHSWIYQLRMCLLILLILSQNCTYAVEQPAQSLLYMHRRWQWLANKVTYVSWFNNLQAIYHSEPISTSSWC